MDRTGSPDKLWFLCLEYIIELNNHCAAESLKWKTPMEIAFGETPDISAFLLFRWYDKILYYDCLLYTSPSPRDGATSRMPSSA